MNVKVTEEMRAQAAENIAQKPVEWMFPGSSQKVRDGVCPLCKQEVSSFKDELSAKEFSISGLCQKCQDSVFGGPGPL